MATVLLGTIGPWQIVIILVIVLLLFGGKKIPELMRGLGKGVNEFKKGKEEGEDDKNENK
jgi:sec-independent protein translocase protein TatA